METGLKTIHKFSDYNHILLASHQRFSTLEFFSAKSLRIVLGVIENRLIGT